MNHEKNFNNQVAIITGGSSGIGFGIAQKLAQEGCKTYLVARNEDRLKSAVEHIINQGGKADYRIADMTMVGQLESVIGEVHEKEQRLDIFVNNAGEFRFSDLQTKYSDIEHLAYTDYLGPLRAAHFAAGKYTNIKILNTLSHAAFRLLSKGIGYGSAKAGLLYGLMQIELDLKENVIYENSNVKILRLYPASVATPQLLELYRLGAVEGPTTLKSVVDTAASLLKDETPSRDAFVGYVPGKGIVAAYYDVNFNSDYRNPNVLSFREEIIIDPVYKPE